VDVTFSAGFDHSLQRGAGEIKEAERPESVFNGHSTPIAGSAASAAFGSDNATWSIQYR
jgi:hypothetical protein